MAGLASLMSLGTTVARPRLAWLAQCRSARLSLGHGWHGWPGVARQDCRWATAGMAGMAGPVSLGTTVAGPRLVWLAQCRSARLSLGHGWHGWPGVARHDYRWATAGMAGLAGPVSIGTTIARPRLAWLA